MAKEKKNKIGPVALLGRIAFLSAIVMLAAYVLIVFKDSDRYVNDFSEKSAQISFIDTLSAAEQISLRPFEELGTVAQELAKADSHDGVDKIMSRYIGSALFGDLRYYTGGESYDAKGLLIEGMLDGKDQLDALAALHESGCTSLYYDSVLKQDCVAFYVPIYGSEYVDGAVSILPARGILSLDSLVTGSISAVMLIDRNGKKLADSHAESFEYDFNNNSIHSILSEVIHDKPTVQEIWDGLSEGKDVVKTASLSDGDYVVCSAPLDRFEGKLSLVTLTKAEGIVAPELVYIRHVANISIISLLALVIGGAYAFSYYRRSRKELDTVTYTDASVGCPNAEMFKKTSGELLAKRDVPYAVVLFELRQFRYMSDTLGVPQMNDFLTTVVKVLETFCSAGETYGYFGDGRFALLMSARNESVVRERLHLIGTVVARSVPSENKAKQYFNIGVANTVKGKRHTVNDLLMYADIACERARNNMNLPYVIFDDNIGSEKKHNERIEAEMESALANGDFRIFLQPKYNVAGDRVDSAEVLVRWFDPKTGDYRFPGEFIGLFETNGFITKLDHYIYSEALKYLSETAERGDKVVPIAVNVSMVTVNSPDFLNFYVENKKKYRIGDNFIIIEFTESFGMGDYDSVRQMVDTLHKNGIRCSLDDFGTGYSSLAMLKNIPFDELKFDRSFLSEGCNAEGDSVIVSSMYALAKDLGIHVVQEGVEDRETFDRVVERGCDVVQGYYYAKAISTEEYRLFVNSNTSIKYKSRVK